MLTAYLFVLLPSLAVLLVADAVPPEVVGVGANNGGNNRRYLRSLVPLRILAASILSHGEIRTRDVPDLCPFNTTCPDGSTARQTGFQIVPNGCGPEGLRSTSFFVPNERVTSCCDQHDICYATCGRSKKGCDNLLRQTTLERLFLLFLEWDCVQSSCTTSRSNIDERSSCLLLSSAFALTTRALGCAAFEDAQTEACVCSRQGP